MLHDDMRLRPRAVSDAHVRQVRFIVMNNLFATGLPIHRRYDLKGSTQGRGAGIEAPPAGAGLILKDLDLDLSLKLEEGWHDRWVHSIPSVRPAYLPPDSRGTVHASRSGAACNPSGACACMQLAQQLVRRCALPGKLRLVDHPAVLGLLQRGHCRLPYKPLADRPACPESRACIQAGEAAAAGLRPAGGAVLACSLLPGGRTAGCCALRPLSYPRTQAGLAARARLRPAGGAVRDGLLPPAGPALPQPRLRLHPPCHRQGVAPNSTGGSVKNSSAKLAGPSALPQTSTMAPRPTPPTEHAPPLFQKFEAQCSSAAHARCRTVRLAFDGPAWHATDRAGRPCTWASVQLGSACRTVRAAFSGLSDRARSHQKELAPPYSH